MSSIGSLVFVILSALFGGGSLPTGSSDPSKDEEDRTELREIHDQDTEAEVASSVSQHSSEGFVK